MRTAPPQQPSRQARHILVVDGSRIYCHAYVTRNAQVAVFPATGLNFVRNRLRCVCYRPREAVLVCIRAKAALFTRAFSISILAQTGIDVDESLQRRQGADLQCSVLVTLTRSSLWRWALRVTLRLCLRLKPQSNAHMETKLTAAFISIEV
jgi:hypothetical protein